MIEELFEKAKERYLNNKNTQYYYGSSDIYERRKELDKQKELDEKARAKFMDDLRKKISEHINKRLKDNDVMRKYAKHELLADKGLGICQVEVNHDNIRNAHKAIRTFDEAHSPTTLFIISLGKTLEITIGDMENYILLGLTTGSNYTPCFLLQITLNDYFEVLYTIELDQSFDDMDNVEGEVNLQYKNVKFGYILDKVIEAMEYKFQFNIGFNYDCLQRANRIIENSNK